MRVLGIIPARGGSKGVPRKNIRPLCGKPLLAYSIESAAKAKLLTRTILSTEDPEIAEVGRQLGVDVPFLRPSELAEDASPTFDVVRHAMATLENEGDRYDAVCILQPTNPLRRCEDIDNCIVVLASTGADSVISVLPVPKTYNPHWVYWKSGDGKMVLAAGENEPITRRQDLPPAFHRDGSVYVTRRSVLLERGSLYGLDTRGYEVDPDYSVNIDTLDDWKYAESLLARPKQRVQSESLGLSQP